MDLTKLIESLSGAPKPWQILLALLFLIFLLFEKVGAFWSAWINLRLGRDELSLEKQRLEIEKLRYEIAAIRKTHELSEIVPMHALTVQRAPQLQALLPVLHAWQVNHPVPG
jgi:hypothetical protein